MENLCLSRSQAARVMAVDRAPAQVEDGVMDRAPAQVGDGADAGRIKISRAARTR